MTNNFLQVSVDKVAVASPNDTMTYSLSPFTESELLQSSKNTVSDIPDPISATVLRVHHLPATKGQRSEPLEAAIQAVNRCVLTSVLSPEFGHWLVEMVNNTEQLRRGNSRKRIRFVEKVSAKAENDLQKRHGSVTKTHLEKPMLRTKEMVASFEGNESLERRPSYNKDDAASLTSCFKSVSRISSLSSAASTSRNRTLQPLLEEPDQSFAVTDTTEFDLDPTSVEWKNLVQALRSAGLFLEAINHGTQRLPWQTAVSTTGQPGFIYRSDSQLMSDRQSKYLSKNRKSLYVPPVDPNFQLPVSKKFLLKPVPSIGAFKRPPPRDASLPSPPDSMEINMFDCALESVKNPVAHGKPAPPVITAQPEDDSQPLVPCTVQSSVIGKAAQSKPIHDSQAKKDLYQLLASRENPSAYIERYNFKNKVIYPSPHVTPQTVQSNSVPSSDYKFPETDHLNSLCVVSMQEDDIAVYYPGTNDDMQAQDSQARKKERGKWMRRLFPIGRTRAIKNGSAIPAH